MMSTRTTIALLVILIALGGYMWWTQNDSTPSQENTKHSSTTVQVMSFSPMDVRAVEVQEKSGKLVRIETITNTWIITAPIRQVANAFQVTQAITSFAELKATRTITPTEGSLAPYGLDAPLHTIRAFDANQKLLAELRIGDKNPSGDSLYVMTHEMIYLVNSFALDSFIAWVNNPPIQPTPLPTPTPTTLPTTVPITATRSITPTITMTTNP